MSAIQQLGSVIVIAACIVLLQACAVGSERTARGDVDKRSERCAGFG